MPNTLNNNYDALVIVFENSTNEDSTFLERELMHVFESQRILYFKNTSMTGDELFQEIWNKMNKKSIFLPNSQRMIICNCLDLNDINENWMQNLRQFMKEFKAVTGATAYTQHQYLTFFKYRSGLKMTVSREEIVDILNAMWKPGNPMPMQHAEYFLYAGGFNTFDSQEKGLVRLLKTLSVEGWSNVFDLAKFKDALHILTFDEYYEKKALFCQEELSKINDWLYKVSDPKLDNLFIEIQDCAKDIIASYKEKMRKFDRWLSLYPVSVREYTAKGFGPFKRYERNSGRNTELLTQKAEYQSTCMAEYQNGDACRKLRDFMEEKLCYSDYKNIEAADENHNVDKRIHNIVDSCGETLDSDEKKNFETLLSECVRGFINEKLESLEEKKREKEEERIRYMYEQNLTTKYQNLQTCFEGIIEGTVYQIPPALPPAPLMSIVYINGEVANGWALKGYHIKGVEDKNVWIDTEIHPLEIQYLKIGRYLTLNAEDTLGNLKMVIH